MAMTSPLETIDTASNLEERKAGQGYGVLGQSTDAPGYDRRDEPKVCMAISVCGCVRLAATRGMN
jgi:hypothetical protein